VRSVSKEIVVKLTRSEQARLGKTAKISLDAYNSYLCGRYFWNRRTIDGVRRTIIHFEQTNDLVIEEW
jgi:hypothetical protein